MDRSETHISREQRTDRSGENRYIWRVERERERERERESREREREREREKERGQHMVNDGNGIH